MLLHILVFLCLNITRAELDANVKKVKAADVSLEDGDLVKARRLAGEAIRFFENAVHSVDPADGKVHTPEGDVFAAPDPGLKRRAIRIDALAMSRAAKSPVDRESAAKRFEADVLGPSPDPTMLADYAEILSRVPSRAGQATMMLRALKEKDLIGSAHAYAALARLEHAAGDISAEKAAAERCKTMAKKSTVCN